MLNDKKLSEFEQVLGHSFKNKDLLTEALTHSSYAHELTQKNIPTKSNERLEFLGDSVLEIIASSYLYENYPQVPEGELTRIRSEVIDTDALSEYARKINLGEFLLLGNGESKSGGKDKPSNLEDAFEAVLGALYLDTNNSLDKARKFLLPFLSERCKGAERDSTDYKSELQQIIQETPNETLSYDTIDKKGPDHAPTYTVNAKLNSNVIGTGCGSSKKMAEQAAAKDALNKFFKKI